MGRWMDWRNGLVDMVVHLATPGRPRTAGLDGVYDGGVPVMGVLTVEATNMEAAVVIAQADFFQRLQRLADLK